MDLMRIGRRLVNLDRLSVVEEEGAGGERKVKLLLGDTTVMLEEPESTRFLDFLSRTFRVRDLEPGPVEVGRGRLVRGGEGGEVLPGDSES